MNEKDLIEKFIEEEALTDEERETLLKALTDNYELTDELQTNLYMDELLEQALDDEKTGDVFIAKLKERINNEKIASKKKTLNRSSSSKKRSHKSITVIPPKKKPSLLPVYIGAVAACLIISLVVAFYIMNQQNNSNSPFKNGDSSNLYVQDIKGSVNITRDGQTNILKEGDFILKGDIISSESSSTCKLYFISEKTVVSIMSDSQLKIGSEISKDTSQKIFFINKGRVGFDVAKQADGTDFLIKTGKSSSRVIGTRLEVSQNKVSVFEGLVRVDCLEAKQTIDLPGNHFVELKGASYPNIKSISGERPEILGYSLIDARKDQLVNVYERLQSGIILKKEDIPKYISIRINVSNNQKISHVNAVLKDSAGDILFKKKEEFLPHSMAGDTTKKGDYEEWDAPAGQYILEVTIFNKSNKKTDHSSLIFTIK
jgi:hypothetical protein